MLLTSTDKNVDISFVIPAYNSQKTIESCVDAILNQANLSKLRFEIIVVDNNSTDNTVKLINRRFKEKTILINEFNQGRSCARNAGAKKAKGAIIAFIDSDVVIPKTWLDESYNVASKLSNWGLLTCVINKSYQELDYIERIRMSLSNKDLKKNANYLSLINIFSPCVNSAAILVKKKCFMEINGFDESFDYLEDLDIGRRIGISGYNLISSSVAINCYLGSESSLKFLTRYYLIGKMIPIFLYKWSERGKLNSIFFALRCEFESIKQSLPVPSKISIVFTRILISTFKVIGIIMSARNDYSSIVKVKKEEFGPIKIIEEGKVIWLDLKRSIVRFFKTN